MKTINILFNIWGNGTGFAGNVYDTTYLSPCLNAGGGSKQPLIMKIKNNTQLGYLEAQDGDGLDLTYPDSKTKRGRVQQGISQTIAVDSANGVLKKEEEMERIRRLTPRECWRLQGFGDEAYDKASKVCSETQLYKQAGNTITVDVLCHIFQKLFADLEDEQ